MGKNGTFGQAGGSPRGKNHGGLFELHARTRWGSDGLLSDDGCVRLGAGQGRAVELKVVFDTRGLGVKLLDNLAKGVLKEQHSGCCHGEVFAVFGYAESDVEGHEDGAELATGGKSVKAFHTVVEEERDAIALLESRRFCVRLSSASYIVVQSLEGQQGIARGL